MDEMMGEEMGEDVKLIQLRAEIEEMMKPDEEDADLDSPDGFRKYLKKKLAKISCLSGKSADVVEKIESGSVRSASSQDFRENRTAYAHLETKPPKQIESDTYDFSYPRRGLAVIINNENFHLSREFDDRPGSSYDASALYHTFRLLGFNVLLHNDLPAWKMVEVLKTAAEQYDHANADCFVCSILTHGDQTWTDRYYERRGTKVRHDLLFGIDGRAVTTKTVVDLFSDSFCPGLEGKPRLFFLQACRGNKYDDGQKILVTKPRNIRNVDYRRGRDAADTGQDQTDKPVVEHQESLSSSVDPPQYHQTLTDTSDAKLDTGNEGEGTKSTDSHPGVGDKTDTFSFGGKDDVPISPAPLYKDCLVMYATPPGYYAWRRGTGAWFVQCLCKVLQDRHLGRMSLLKALVIVSGHVAKYYKSNTPDEEETHEKKEIPIIETMLVKDIFLFSKRWQS